MAANRARRAQDIDMSDSEDKVNGEGYDEGDDQSVEDNDGMDELFGDGEDSAVEDQSAEYAYMSPCFSSHPARVLEVRLTGFSEPRNRSPVLANWMTLSWILVMMKAVMTVCSSMVMTKTRVMHQSANSIFVKPLLDVTLSLVVVTARYIVNGPCRGR